MTLIKPNVELLSEGITFLRDAISDSDVEDKTLLKISALAKGLVNISKYMAQYHDHPKDAIIIQTSINEIHQEINKLNNTSKQLNPIKEELNNSLEVMNKNILDIYSIVRDLSFEIEQMKEAVHKKDE